MALDFDHKHPLYERARMKRILAMDLYEGGKRVEGREHYLVRHPYETDKQYEIRLERSAYRNFAAPIVDVFSSYVCDGRPQRTLPAILEPMLDDIDRRQTGADVFFANAVRLAAARGASFLVCDMELSRGVTLAEDREAGRRVLPYFVAVDPDDIFDWSIDDRGLAWCVVHAVEPVASEAFGSQQVRDTITLWTRQGWQKYGGIPRLLTTIEDMEPVSIVTETATLISEGTHPLGEVPIVPFLFEQVTPMTGNPVTDDVLSLILRVYRRDSELDKMLFDCAVPLAVINGLDVKQKNEFIRSSSNILISSNYQGISAQYLEPQGHSFNALREALANDIQSIREIALRMVRPQSGIGESAESKNIDKQQLDTQLANYARRCANAERKCWELAYKWLNNGDQPEREAISTPYNEDYSVDAMYKLDRMYLLEMLQAGAISNETYLELLQKIGSLGEDFDVAQEVERLNAQEKPEEEKVE